MKSKYYMVMALALLAQELTAQAITHKNVPSAQKPQGKISEEASVSDFGFFFTLAEIIFLFLEDSSGILECYLNEETTYKSTVTQYLSSLHLAATKLKQGIPKPQEKIAHAMHKYPKKLTKYLLGKDYETLERHIWSLSSNISVWDYQLHLEIKKLKMSSLNNMALTHYEKIFLKVREKTEEDCKKIVDRLTECMEDIESNF